MHKSYLISIEGIDGSGKSSIAHWLNTELKNKGFYTYITKEPGATLLGKHVRALLQDRPFELCSKAEFLLFAADRAQHMHEIIKTELDKGAIVISDRMADSSLAYQGFGRGLDREFISMVNAWAMNGQMPNLTLYIKVDYKTAINRLKERNEKITSFEKEHQIFFDNVISGFETIFKDRSNVIVIDGTQKLVDVQENVRDAVLTVFKQQALL